MTDSPTSSPAEKPPFVWTLPAAERHAHVVQRMAQRGGITWTVEQVAALEAKINMVRQRMHLNKPVAPILPKLIGKDKPGDTVQYWRVLIAGLPTTFVFSKLCRGLISFRGPGEMVEPHITEAMIARAARLEAKKAAKAATAEVSP